MNPEKIADSVKNCKLDKYHAIYYLAIKNEKANQRQKDSSEDIDRFKKQRKSSVIKLKPISKTPSISRKKQLIDKANYMLSLKTSRVEKDGILRMGHSRPSINLPKSFPLTP